MCGLLASTRPRRHPATRPSSRRTAADAALSLRAPSAEARATTVRKARLGSGRAEEEGGGERTSPIDAACIGGEGSGWSEIPFKHLALA